jgi:hypothetical protein
MASLGWEIVRIRQHSCFEPCLLPRGWLAGLRSRALSPLALSQVPPSLPH